LLWFLCLLFLCVDIVIVIDSIGIVMILICIVGNVIVIVVIAINMIRRVIDINVIDIY